MKILYFVRLYSGLEDGLSKGEWIPKGVPTITKMIENLDNGEHDLKIMFTCKDYGSSWDLGYDVTIQPNGLNSDVEILAGEKVFPVFFGRLCSRLSIIRHTYKLMVMIKKYRPDIVYIDRGNLWAAAFVSRFSIVPVIWRVMGVLRPMHDAIEQHDWRSSLYKWAFKSPFAAVICTIDGSGGELWVELALKSGVPRHLLLNGVDTFTSKGIPQDSSILPTNKTIVLFVGRIEENKGVDEFLSAFIEALKITSGGLYGVIIGDGSMLEVLKLKAREFVDNNDLLFTGSLTQQEVLSWQKSADIYVSLNKMGNLSNANIEAIASGACMIVPKLKNDLTLLAEHIVPDKVVFRFGYVDEVIKLAKSIVYLHDNPNIRKKMSDEALNFSRQVFKSWKERVQLEIDIIEQLNEEHSMQKEP